MKVNSGNTRYTRLSFLQEGILCFINIFFSFLDFFKRIFLYLLHSNEDHKTTFVYPSLKSVDTIYSCIVDPEQDPCTESYDDHIQSFEPHETKADIPSPILNHMPSKIPERYKCLKLPSILHDFPPKHHKYLPKFDGDLDTLKAQKHVQDFEHFSYSFEIDYDYVLVLAFSQSIQGNAKEWFRHLQPE